MARSKEEYWVSSSINFGPVQSTSDNICLLSLALEGGMSSKISGVRLVIIDPGDRTGWQQGPNAAIKFWECPDTRGLLCHEDLTVPKSKSYSSPRRMDNLDAPHGGYRVTRERIKARALRAKTPTPTSNAYQLPVPEIVLRLTVVDLEAEKLANGFCMLDPPLYFLKVHTAKLGSNSQNCPLAFDSFYSVGPNNPTLSLVLVCTEPFFIFGRAGPEDAVGFSFSIFPLDTISNASVHQRSQRQSKIIELPPRILLAIVRETLPPSSWGSESNKTAHWVRTIRSCALVCTSWAFLIRVLFENFGTESYHASGFLPFVKNVIAQPTMGHFIREFSEDGLLGAYKRSKIISDGTPLPHDVVDGSKSLLHLAPFISKVSVDQRLLSVITTDMARLSMVEDFTVADLPWHTEPSNPPWNREPSNPMVTFEQIYQMTLNWKKLRRFDISTPLSVAGSEIMQLPVAPYALDYVRLRRGGYEVHQILSLLSSSGTSLTNLVLWAVSGINNNGLLQILLHVSPGLENLIIRNSFFPTPNEEEEKAFDVAVSKALNLKTVEINVENVSAACLSRKAPQPRINDEARHFCTPASIQVIRSKPRTRWPWSAEDLHSALDHTEWTTIFLDGTTYTPDEYKRLKRAAAARGVELRFR